MYKICGKNDLGSVGAYETSSLKCNCPRKIQFIYSDIITFLVSIVKTDWSEPVEVPNNEMPIPLGKKTLTNNCDDTGNAEYHDGQWIYPPCQLKTYAPGHTKTFTNT